MYPVLCIDVDEHAKQSLIDRRGQRAAARHVTIFLFPRNLLSLPISFSLFRPRPRYLFRALSHACGMACVLFCSPIVALTRSDGCDRAFASCRTLWRALLASAFLTTCSLLLLSGMATGSCAQSKVAPVHHSSPGFSVPRF
jgi:hypothetical protein